MGIIPQISINGLPTLIKEAMHVEGRTGSTLKAPTRNFFSLYPEIAAYENSPIILGISGSA